MLVHKNTHRRTFFYLRRVASSIVVTGGCTDLVREPSFKRKQFLVLRTSFEATVTLFCLSDHETNFQKELKRREVLASAKHLNFCKTLLDQESVFSNH